MPDIVVGARGSALALRQTELLIAALHRLFPRLRVHLQTIRTTADHHPNRRFEQLPGIGFFVKELEVALLAREIDVAVHSMKDLPSSLPEGLTIAAVTEREDPRDVLVARNGLTLDTLPTGARVGTSSPRRAACLRAQRADLAVVPVRGNVETRIRQVDRDEVDAVCLAGAGLRRLGMESRVTQWLPLETFLPAPGQGALGVEVRSGDADTLRIASAVDDRLTRSAVEAERALLRRMEGGCRVPLGALARIEGDQVALTAMLAALDGSTVVRGVRTGPLANAQMVGEGLADELLARSTTLQSRGQRVEGS